MGPSLKTRSALSAKTFTTKSWCAWSVCRGVSPAAIMAWYRLPVLAQLTSFGQVLTSTWVSYPESVICFKVLSGVSAVLNVPSTKRLYLFSNALAITNCVIFPENSAVYLGESSWCLTCIASKSG